MQQGLTNSIVLVLGGVRSGKSRFAQTLAERSDRVTFVATAECRDDKEMQHKIQQHRAERSANWATLEEPLCVAAAIRSAAIDSDVVLVDCLTVFAANLLEAYGEDEVRRRGEVDDLCDALRSSQCAVILVSNEVGWGVVPAYRSGRRFRDFVGELNQRVAAVADTVVLMVAGLPMVIKEPARVEVQL